MVTLHFVRTDGRVIHWAGPFPWVQATGGSLQSGPHGEELACYRGGIWSVAGHTVAKWIVHGTDCIARFLGDDPVDSTTYGPFNMVEFVDGSMYAEHGRCLLARLDEHTQAWYCYEDKRSWLTLVVEDRG
jgi:hypothetical protein